MPKSTYFNLSEEKKENIINSASRIFRSTKYEDVTIRDLAGGAGIPVGSFYRYFQDKEDLYFYMLDGVERKIYDAVINLKNRNFTIPIGSLSQEFIDGVLTREEAEFDRTFYDIPEEILLKYYYHFDNCLISAQKKELERLDEEGVLRKDVDRDLMNYIYRTSMFTISLYFREKNITSHEDKEKIKNDFFNKIMLTGFLGRNQA